MGTRLILVFVLPALLLIALLTAIQEVAGASLELQWQRATAPLSPERYAHTLVEGLGTLYILGGETSLDHSIPPTNIILCGDIFNSNGNVIKWRSAATLMDVAVSDAAAV